MINGERDPDRLEALRLPGLGASREDLREALRGVVRDHHRIMLRLHLTQVDAMDAAIRTVEDRTAA
jgi:hypothetical protein